MRDLEIRLRAQQSSLDTAKGELALLTRLAHARDVELCGLQDEQRLLQQVIEVFGVLSGELQTTFIGNIERLVTHGVQSVFGPEYVFKIIQGSYGKQPTMSFSLDGGASGEPQDMLHMFGGGLNALVGVIIRIVVLRLLQGRQRQVLFLDEPLAMLSAQYREPAAALLRDLAHELQMQIVMVTHHSEFAEYADKTVTLEKRNGATTIQDVVAEPEH